MLYFLSNILKYSTANLLFFIIVILFLFIISILFIPKQNIIFIKKLTLIYSFIILFFTVVLLILRNDEIGTYIYIVHFPWLNFFNIYYSIGVDGLSIYFIILTSFLIPLCILISWNSITYKVKEYMLMLLITEWLLINVFSVLDLFFFYIFFESVLIPMFIIIGIWGSRQRKIHAAYQFFFYTLFGSILMLIGILIIYFDTGTTDIQLLAWTVEFSVQKQLILWLAFFSSFAVKIPLFPLHIWLPEAHVEAPTAGSVILAGVLLKLGTYGIFRFMIPLFPYGMWYFTPLVQTLCLLGIVYSSLVTIRQVDLKKVIAYSSVAHMNFALLGLFTNQMEGLEGCLYYMLGHGLVSSALFFSIGMLYDRYHTRTILYYGGLIQTMPIFGLFFLILTFSNMGFPGTVNFIGEFLVSIGVWKTNPTILFLGSFGVILSAVYSIWFFNRIMFGPIKFYSLLSFIDIQKREFCILLPLIFLILNLGIYPILFLDIIDLSTNNYII